MRERAPQHAWMVTQKYPSGLYAIGHAQNKTHRDRALALALILTATVAGEGQVQEEDFLRAQATEMIDLARYVRAAYHDMGSPLLYREQRAIAPAPSLPAAPRPPPAAQGDAWAPAAASRHGQSEQRQARTPWPPVEPEPPDAWAASASARFGQSFAASRRPALPPPPPPPSPPQPEPLAAASTGAASCAPWRPTQASPPDAWSEWPPGASAPQRDMFHPRRVTRRHSAPPPGQPHNEADWKERCIHWYREVTDMEKEVRAQKEKTCRCRRLRAKPSES